MTPEEYCRNKAAPAGSSLYYASLYHSPQEQRRLFALFALRDELMEVVCRASDPGAARLTLSWWMEELDGLFSGTVRHPVTRALSAPACLETLSKPALLAGVAGLAQFLDTPEAGPYQDWLARHRAAGGYIWEAAGRACGCADPAQLAVLNRAGCCEGALELLHHLRHFAGLGLNVFPADLLAEHGLNLETLVQAAPDPDVNACCATLCARLHEELCAGLDALRDTGPAAPLFAVILPEILAALCRKYQRAGRPITHQRLALSPLRKLLIAWRAKRP